MLTGSPLAAVGQMSLARVRTFFEMVDNTGGAYSVDIDGDADTGDASGNEIIFAGKIRVEKGSFTPKDETEPESTYEHYYKDYTGEHLGGKDTFDFGAETQIWGANWQAGAREADVSKLKGAKAPKPVETSDLPSDFIDSALDSAGVAYSEIEYDVAWDASNGVFIFTDPANSDAVVTSIVIQEGDTVTFDLSALAATDAALKFSTAADGSAPFTTGVVDSGVLGTDLETTVTLDATATTRAFTADSTTELYIYGVNPADGTVINTSLTSVDVKDTKTIYGSTEDFPWGGSETTYYVNGQVIGYSESQSDMGAPAGGTPAGGAPAAGYGGGSNLTFFDNNHEYIGDSWDDGMGNGGSNFRIRLDAALDIDGVSGAEHGTGSTGGQAEYIQESGTSRWSYTDPVTNQQVSQTSEYTTYYAAANATGNEPDWGQMLGGRDVYDGIETMYGPNWQNLGQKSSVDFNDASAAAAAGIREVADAEFAGLPASFKAASGKTFVREESYGDLASGYQSTEATYMDDTGKVLGYANSNSDTYTDANNNSVTNSNINFSSANWEPLGGSWTDEFGTGSNIFEIVDNTGGAYSVDIDGDADTGDASGNEIIFAGKIRVEKGSFTPKDETEPESTYEHYYKDSTGEHLGGKDTFDFGAETQIWGANWQAGAREADVSKLKGAKAPKPVETSDLPSDFIDSALDSAGVAYSEIEYDVAWDDSNGVFIFTDPANSDAVVTSIVIQEGDTVTFDLSALAATDAALKFSTAADGSAPFTTGVVDSGVLGTDLETTVTLDATATTRAFTADSTTELYIYGVKPADGTVINTSLTSVDVKDTKTIYGSTEDFPWGGSETTYYVNGQVIGYSESQSDMGAPAGGTPAGGAPAAGYGGGSNLTFFDNNHEYIGDSWDDGMGNGGSNFRIRLDAALDIDGDTTPEHGTGSTGQAEYIPESGTSKWSYTDPVTNQQVSQTSEYTTYYAAASATGNEPDWGQMLGGRDVYDGIETMYGPNWQNLGQKSVLTLMMHLRQQQPAFVRLRMRSLQDFLPHSRQRLARPFVREESYGDLASGYQSTEATYMDDTGKVLGYANSNSDTYTDASNNSVTNSNINFSSANWEPLGGSWTDEFGTGSNIFEIVDNTGGAYSVDIDGDADTGDASGNEIIFAGKIRVEKGSFTPKDETEPESTYEHY